MSPNPDSAAPNLQNRQLRRFFADPEQFHSGAVRLSPAESHHLINVLRLQKGERVEVSDGCGKVYWAEISALEPAAAQLQIISEISASYESRLHVTLGLALVRSETFDLIVRQVTEMGINQLVPFHSSRSLIKPENWRKTRHHRWLRLAQGALKSSRREQVPAIAMPVDFSEVLAGTEDLKILFWEHQSGYPSPVGLKTARRPKSVRALIGPEGGFTTAEVATAQEAGFFLMGLGPRRLRVETAALAAVAILQYLWGDLGL